jgi:hypothetical protein
MDDEALERRAISQNLRSAEKLKRAVTAEGMYRVFRGDFASEPTCLGDVVTQANKGRRTWLGRRVTPEFHAIEVLSRRSIVSGITTHIVDSMPTRGGILGEFRCQTKRATDQISVPGVGDDQ